MRFIARFTDDVRNATLFVLSDRPKEKVDAIFFFGRAKGDDTDGLFQFVVQASKTTKEGSIIINGGDGRKKGGSLPGEAWAGSDIWTAKLAKAGARSVHVCTKVGFDTREEAHSMVAYAKEIHCRSAVIVAWPHQLLRCMASTIKATKNLNYPMRIYCMAPPRCHWFDFTAGSQGMGSGMERQQHITLEYNRVQTYSKKGDIATAAEVIEYIRWRDEE